MANPGSALARNQLRKAGRIAKWAYTQENGMTGTSLTRDELVNCMHEFQDLTESLTNVKFWSRVGDACGEARPSQETIDMVIEILDIVEDICGE